MPIDSLSYIVFVIVAFASYWCCRSSRAQNFVLVTSSLFFYGSWNWRMVGLLVCTGLWTYLMGFNLARKPSRRLLDIAISPLLGEHVCFNELTAINGEMQ